MTTSLALSTMYFQRWPDQHSLEPFFAAGREMGFAAFELSHILAPATVAAVDGRRTPIATVHHPCPRPMDMAPGDDLTARDGAARARAVRALNGSIATASRLGAPAVVLHLGRADDPERQLARLRFEVDNRFRAGQRGQARYEAARAALAEAVAAAEPAALARALDALAEPVAMARAAGVRLGIETGKEPDELPTPTGMRAILAAFPPPTVGAWLDTGHVGAQAELGLASFEAWFSAVGERWLGAHYHDVVGLRDHLVPGAGTLDFAAIAARLPAGSQATLEVDWYHDPAEVVDGAAWMRRALAAHQATRSPPRDGAS